MEMQDQHDMFSTPPKAMRRWFSVPVQTDIPSDQVRRYSNQVFRDMAEGNLNGYTPALDQRKLVPTHRFDGKDWIDWDIASELAATTCNSTLDPTKVKNLSFYTHNIWFGKKNEDERFKNLIQMIWDSDADFVCLQEVVAPFFELLVHNDEIRGKYYFSGNSITDYGLLILSKWPCYFYDFPFANTWMGRSLLVAETVFNGKTFLTWTSHLESLDNKAKRREQTEYVQHNLLYGFDSVFMGDFNFDFTWADESSNIDWKQYQDLWQQLKDEKEEWYTKNGTSHFKPVTLDHVLLSKSSQFKPKFIKRVGNYCCRNYGQDLINDIREDDVVRTPSDHLGLYAVISD